MTSCPFGYQSGESGHQRPRATTTGVLPPATRLVRTVRGRDANSRPSPEIGKGDPSKCCTGVQTSAMPVVRFPLKLRAHDPRRWHNATPSPERPRPGFPGGDRRDVSIILEDFERDFRFEEFPILGSIVGSGIRTRWTSIEQDGPMSQARIMLQVRGLDCPNEVAALCAALRDQEAINGLGFDLINGTMTVDYQAGALDPAGLARLIGERTGMQATVQGEPEGSGASWWSRYGEWVLTIGSGLALALGMAFSWLGPAMGLGSVAAGRLSVFGYAMSVVIGGVGLFPRAARNLLRLHLDIDVLMGLAILGAMALGQWDEAATVAFLYGLSEALEALSLDRARRSIRALLDLAPPTAERIGPDGSVQVVPAGQVRQGDRLLVRAGRHDPGRRRGAHGPFER